jgi:hypothetical protein
MDGSEMLSPGVMDKAADLLHKVAGPAVEEVGLMIGAAAVLEHRFPN